MVLVEVLNTGDTKSPMSVEAEVGNDDKDTAVVFWKLNSGCPTAPRVACMFIMSAEVQNRNVKLRCPARATGFAMEIRDPALEVPGPSKAEVALTVSPNILPDPRTGTGSMTDVRFLLLLPTAAADDERDVHDWDTFDHWHPAVLLHIAG